ncbi:MAG TPA: preprotein translocase subunit SecE [Gemmatimonadota bacterium]|nr:preprotein translocase subunit SecE [Gemmatimonadota bacterium]
MALAERIERTKLFVDQTVDEMKKVTWPDWPQLRNATFVILIFVIVVALIIWLMDRTVSFALNLIIDLFAG